MSYNIQQISYKLATTGSSQAVSISSTSAQSAVINASLVTVTPTVDTFVRQGENPTALATGVDLFLLGQGSYRIEMSPGMKLAFITTGLSGTAYITPSE